MNARQLAYELLKKEGSAAKALYSGAKGAFKGFLQSGELAARHMAEQGVKSPVALATAKLSPYAVLAYGGKKGYESETGQRARYNIDRYLQERRMKKALRAQRGY